MLDTANIIHHTKYIRRLRTDIYDEMTHQMFFLPLLIQSFIESLFISPAI